MNTPSAQEAIFLALSGKWEGALEINKQIIHQNPSDIDALNRLARAHFELGNIPKAKSATQKALKVDSTNSIAIKSLEKYRNTKKSNKALNHKHINDSFLEEPCKTKLVTLIHPGDSKVTNSLYSGDVVKLLTYPHRISVTTEEGKYIGRLPDDLAAKFRHLIKTGNKYETYIKSVDDGEITIFIKGNLIQF